MAELKIYYSGYDFGAWDTISTIKHLFWGVLVFEVESADLLESIQDGDSRLSFNLPNCGHTAAEFLSGTQGNCAELCSDPSTSMLPWNMRTCYSLGVAAMLVENGTLAIDYSAEYSGQEELQYGNLSEWDGAKVISDFATCISSSCTTANISHCDEKTLALETMDITTENLGLIQDGMFEFCSYGVEINADIAGPGVMISYLLQICAVIFLWVLFNLLTKWAWIVVSPIWVQLKQGEVERARLDPFLTDGPTEKRSDRIKDAWERASDMQKRLSQWRLYQATSAILRDFQDVQIFFIGAIQIATLSTFRPKASASSDANSVNSFGAAIMDSELVQMLAVNSMIPLLLMQSMIQRGDRYKLRETAHTKHRRLSLTWYTFILVWITFVLAIVVHARRDRLIANYDILLATFQTEKAVEACGWNPNPMVYCNIDNGLDTQFNAGIPVIPVAVSLLTIDFVVFHVPGWRRWDPSRRMEGAMNPAQAQVFKWFRKCHWRILTRVIWFCLECALLASSALYLADIIAVTRAMSGGSNSWGGQNSSGSWSFGQLIAVMVWVPTLFKFLFYLKFGVEDNATTRDAHSDGGDHDDHTFVEMDPLQGVLASDVGAGKPKHEFWAGSRNSLVNGMGDSRTGTYGFVRNVYLGT
ncbi:hypothetical protein KVR01_007443 [Diaporthe batatas]|uniref:uncharacterized protein n=1 Tax=Diaporthe batatas TaxID=748121 RepID=UPI001D05AB1D|nr:uncharacterized protein KVR01_007443 [Diaporthe batatas]KAG8162965.1 hypothetical protein KVR01_007443 [Diaporthe batatas]